jgi:hypothetical protein
MLRCVWGRKSTHSSLSSVLSTLRFIPVNVAAGPSSSACTCALYGGADRVMGPADTQVSLAASLELWENTCRFTWLYLVATKTVHGTGVGTQAMIVRE